jgi:hypothetical protein
MKDSISGSIVSVIRNDEGLYEGNLAHYFRVLFFQAQNLRHPYHNLRHMLHVLWLCFEAIRYYHQQGRPITLRVARSILIAAMFHDFDHSGLLGNDDLNIERAVRGLKKCILPEDEPFLDDIVALLWVTEYPYKVPSDSLELPGQILRDADMSQSLHVAWIQQVIVGLAAEWGKTPLEILRAQGNFHKGLVFHTEWARVRFPQELVDQKINEARELLELLDTAA